MNLLTEARKGLYAGFLLSFAMRLIYFLIAMIVSSDKILNKWTILFIAILTGIVILIDYKAGQMRPFRLSFIKSLVYPTTLVITQLSVLLLLFYGTSVWINYLIGYLIITALVTLFYRLMFKEWNQHWNVAEIGLLLATILIGFWSLMGMLPQDILAMVVFGFTTLMATMIAIVAQNSLEFQNHLVRKTLKLGEKGQKCQSTERDLRVTLCRTLATMFTITIDPAKSLPDRISSHLVTYTIFYNGDKSYFYENKKTEVTFRTDQTTIRLKIIEANTVDGSTFYINVLVTTQSNKSFGKAQLIPFTLKQLFTDSFTTGGIVAFAMGFFIILAELQTESLFPELGFQDMVFWGIPATIIVYFLSHDWPSNTTCKNNWFLALLRILFSCGCFMLLFPILNHNVHLYFEQRWIGGMWEMGIPAPFLLALSQIVDYLAIYLVFGIAKLMTDVSLAKQQKLWFNASLSIFLFGTMMFLHQFAPQVLHLPGSVLRWFNYTAQAILVALTLVNASWFLLTEAFRKKKTTTSYAKA